MLFHNKNRISAKVTTTLIVFTLTIVFTSTTNQVTAITTASNTTTTTSPSSGLELSPQPVWDEVVVNTGVTPINETHTIVTFIGNGTMTVPDTGKAPQGKGIIIAVFDRKATGMLAPFNGMIVTGIHDEPPNVEGSYYKTLGVEKWNTITITITYRQYYSLL